MEKNKLIALFFFVSWGILFCTNAEARVDRIIQNYYESAYEDKAFVLRVDLESYAKQKNEFVYNDGFIFSERKKGGSREIRFIRGERVIIDKVDFDAKDIKIVFVRVSDGEEGEVSFEFPARIDGMFPQKRLFDAGFEAIFLSEKEVDDVEVDSAIMRAIALGKIEIGMSREELVLTLGRPSDIVTTIKELEKQEILVYVLEGRVYRFMFVDNVLKNWTDKSKKMDLV